MKTVTFAEDNPLAQTWFRMLYQAVALATPGPRAITVQALEARVLAALEQVSDPDGDPQANGYQPRRLREPCTVALDPQGLALASTYLAGAGYQPYLSRCVLELLALLAAAPDAPAPDP